MVSGVASILTAATMLLASSALAILSCTVHTPASNNKDFEKVTFWDHSGKVLQGPQVVSLGRSVISKFVHHLSDLRMLTSIV